MPGLNTTSVSLAVTPTVVSTLFSHYLNKKAKSQRPTAHLSYDEGLHLIRSFLDFASHHTVEELQAFTAQWVPHPQWVKVKEDAVSNDTLKHAAELLQTQLGPEGVRQVGGKEWWQWRKEEKKGLEAEWIEMRAHAQARKKKMGGQGKGSGARRVMMYVHGGAYFFGSVDEHRYQMQRHARKLKARVFAPKYRLAPQFPFPCGLHDCLAAYLHLLKTQGPETIVLAGDSAGGGMVMSLLVVLRDQGIPLPAGAVLISPWVDLTHSFPSVAGDAPWDYIPQAGFHHKPSRSWPPPNEDDERMLREEAKGRDGKNKGTSALKEQQQGPVTAKVDDEAAGEKRPEETGGIVSRPEDFLSITIDGEDITIKDQIQMYTTNLLLEHPLVSPIMQPTLGGLPPLLIMVGGGEILRDEQIYLAHKCANPQRYAPANMTEAGVEMLWRYNPTSVQLQVWDDLCHVAPTLSFTRPAKYMYRSVAQFGAWALARAQRRGIDILDDDAISVISSDSPTDEDADDTNQKKEEGEQGKERVGPQQGAVGKAGDPLPRFKNHMIRQRVTRHGVTLPLVPETDLPALNLPAESIGHIKEGPVRKWLATKKQWDSRFASTKAKVHKRTITDMQAGFEPLAEGEKPPPTALAGRRRKGEKFEKGKGKRKSLGLAVWSLWGSKHDEETVERERKVEEEEEKEEKEQHEQKEEQKRERGLSAASQKRPGGGEGEGGDGEMVAFPKVNDGGEGVPERPTLDTRSRSRRRTVVDENQTDDVYVDESTPVSRLVQLRKEKERAMDAHEREMQGGEHGEGNREGGEKGDGEGNGGEKGYLTPEYYQRRPHLGGIAMPFSVKKEAETASMVTLDSGMDSGMERPMSPLGGGGVSGETRGGGGGSAADEGGVLGETGAVGGKAV